LALLVLEARGHLHQVVQMVAYQLLQALTQAVVVGVVDITQLQLPQETEVPVEALVTVAAILVAWGIQVVTRQ
jgi:hypothetical protein